MIATLAPLQAIAFLLAPLGATAVVLTRDPARQIIVNGVYGLSLSVLFFVLQAPDVALSMLVVSSVAYPLVVLAAHVRASSREQGEQGPRGGDAPEDGGE